MIDYKAKFKSDIDALYARVKVGGEIITAAERISTVDALVEEYIACNSERPDAYQLDRLSYWILMGDLADKKREADELKRRKVADAA